MQDERPVGVAQRLQRRDLFALCGHQPPEDDVQEERRHAEEDGRNRRRHDALLLDLVVEETVRGLLAASVGAEPAPGLQQPIESVDHGRLRGAWGERQDHVVEGAFHVEGCLQGGLADPDDGEAAVVGKRIAAPDREDVLGGERHADDPELLPPSVQDRHQAITGIETVGVGEALAQDHLVAASRIDLPAAAEVEPIDAWPVRGQRDHPADGRRIVSGDVEGDVEHQSALHLGDPG